MNKYSNIYSNYDTTLENTKISHTKHTIALHFKELLPKKTRKYSPQIE